MQFDLSIWVSFILKLACGLFGASAIKMIEGMNLWVA